MPVADAAAAVACRPEGQSPGAGRSPCRRSRPADVCPCSHHGRPVPAQACGLGELQAALSRLRAGAAIGEGHWAVGRLARHVYAAAVCRHTRALAMRSDGLTSRRLAVRSAADTAIALGRADGAVGLRQVSELPQPSVVVPLHRLPAGLASGRFVGRRAADARVAVVVSPPGQSAWWQVTMLPQPSLAEPVQWLPAAWQAVASSIGAQQTPALQSRCRNQEASGAIGRVASHHVAAQPSRRSRAAAKG